MTTTEPVRGRHVPQRLCVVCRNFRPKAELFRLARFKDQPGLCLGMGGKGVYLCRQAACLDRLQKDRRLRRLIKEKLLPGTLERMLGELGSEEPSRGSQVVLVGE